MTATGTWYPPTFGAGGFLADAGQMFSNPPFAPMTLPDDYARCAGAGPVQMQPPSIVAGWCEYHISTELSDDD